MIEIPQFKPRYLRIELIGTLPDPIRNSPKIPYEAISYGRPQNNIEYPSAVLNIFSKIKWVAHTCPVVSSS